MYHPIATVNLILALGIIVLFDNVRSNSENDNNISEESWIVETNSGPIEAIVTTGFTKDQVFTFYGIPYAETPTGDLRFKPPQPKAPWSNVLKATKYSQPCYQTHDLAHSKNEYSFNKVLKRPWSEDCLNLNIWVPKPKIEDTPVLVVFHPGWFRTGSNQYPDGSTLAGYAKVIVVSMNYRLGAFGFLNVGVPDAPGNVGLLDQQLALKWVYDNIRKFGGISEAIILVGGGDAGTASVGYHMLSPESYGFFKTTCLCSGAPTCSWAFQDIDTSLQNARSLSEALGCFKENTTELLACLRDVHPEDIAQAGLSGNLLSSMQFLPTVDGRFITQSPRDALRAGHFKRTVYFSASNINEGSLLFWDVNRDILPNPEKGLNIEGFRKAVRRIKPSLSDGSMNLVEEYYLDKCNATDILKIRDAAIRLYGDLLVDCPVNEMDKYVSEQGGTVYRYVEDLTKATNPSWVGAQQAISAEYIFGYPLGVSGYNDDERDVSLFVMEWTKDRSRQKVSVIEKEAAVYNTSHKTYNYYNITGGSVDYRYRDEHCELWDEIIPKLENAKTFCGQK